MNLPSTLVSAALSLLFAVFLTARAYAVEVVEDLKLVQLIFRHGDRAPLHTYKTDPYSQSIWKNGLGRLTSIGMKQQYEAGKFYRQRYSKFLDPTEGPNQVYIRSSDQDRSLQSAEAFSAGLFPPSVNTIWDDGLGKIWRPVTIHTILWEEENLLSKQAACPAFTRLQAECADLPEARHLYKTHRSVFDFVVNGSGAETRDRKSAWETLTHVHDVVFCQHANGFPLPTWLNETVFKQMHFLSDLFFHLQFGANEDLPRARLAGGNLLALVLKRMLDKVHQTANQTKAFIYSAHDSTVAGILATLELYDYNETTGNFIGIPRYTSALLIELFQNNSVRISLKNNPDDIPSSEPQVLRHPKCDKSLCSLDVLVEATKDYVVQDWDRECNGKFGDGIDVDDVTIALITIVLVIVLTTFALGCYKRRSRISSPLLRNAQARPDSALSVNYTMLDQEDAAL